MQFDNLALTALAKSSIQPHWFVWVKAKNRITGETEEAGFWTGIGPIALLKNGVERTYAGCGGLISLDQIKYDIGTNVQSQSVRLAIMSPEVFEQIRVYEPMYGACDICLALVDPEHETLACELQPVFDGYIDSIEETESETSSECVVNLVSSSRLGSRPLYSKQSDAYQKTKGNPNDTGRLYASIAGSIKLNWGDS